MTVQVENQKNYFKIKEATLQIVDNMQFFMNYFGIQYNDVKNRFSFSCPVHGSDNIESASIFKRGVKHDGNFVCWTRHCEQEIGYTAYDLFKYLLNKKEHIDYDKWLENNKIKFSDYDNNTLELIEFNNFVSNHFNNESIYNKPIQSREYVRNKLIIPCQYFLDRGYQKETLDYFDIGLCITKGSGAYMRATVPVYDDDGNQMIGYVARSINDKCKLCNMYHYYKHPCPRNPVEVSFARKWRNSEGFYSGATLYNIWNITGNTVIIVEGQSDVWRLYEAGCKCGVGIFGCNLTNHQLQKLLEKQIHNVVLCLDNDNAGKEALQKIIDKLSMYFNIQVIETKAKDIGDTSIPDVKKLLKGIKWQLLA